MWTNPAPLADVELVTYRVVVPTDCARQPVEATNIPFLVARV